MTLINPKGNELLNKMWQEQQKRIQDCGETLTQLLSAAIPLPLVYQRHRTQLFIRLPAIELFPDDSLRTSWLL